ncbi:exonuclease [Klebsiella pneumoniae]|nr:exonuclease [Klebsiella pneumoniae]
MKMSYFLTLLAEVCTGVAPEVNAKALAWGNSMRPTLAPCLSSPPTCK